MTTEKKKKWRKLVYNKIFQGENIEDESKFYNANLKGLRFTPYPKHILELKQNVENQIKKTKPNMDHIIYQGHEIMPNIDNDYKDSF